MRKLASIQKIVSVNPIEGADVIVRAQVLGWNLVTQKSNDFQPGDLVVYHEIDSLLPEVPEYEFMAKAGVSRMADGSSGYRLKSIKLRGVVSQGLILPLSLLSHKFPEVYVPAEGDEVTDWLGIKKWEAPIPPELAGKAKAAELPTGISKTDEERVQNLQEMLTEIKGRVGNKTVKIDGASQTNYLVQGEFGVCSRNTDYLESDSNSHWKVARALDLEQKLRDISASFGGIDVALQGEIYGEGINGNKLKKKGQHFAAFNLINVTTQEYFPFHQFKILCEFYSIPTVPILDEVYIIHDDIEQYLKEADEVKYENGAQAEGIVIRTNDNERWRGSRVSFKAISNKFLLKNGE